MSCTRKCMARQMRTIAYFEGLKGNPQSIDMIMTTALHYKNVNDKIMPRSTIICYRRGGKAKG